LRFAYNPLERAAGTNRAAFTTLQVIVEDPSLRSMSLDEVEVSRGDPPVGHPVMDMAQPTNRQGFAVVVVMRLGFDVPAHLTRLPLHQSIADTVVDERPRPVAIWIGGTAVPLVLECALLPVS